MRRRLRRVRGYEEKEREEERGCRRVDEMAVVGELLGRLERISAQKSLEEKFQKGKNRRFWCIRVNCKSWFLGRHILGGEPRKGGKSEFNAGEGQ